MTLENPGARFLQGLADRGLDGFLVADVIDRQALFAAGVAGKVIEHEAGAELAVIAQFADPDADRDVGDTEVVGYGQHRCRVEARQDLV